MNRKLAIGNIVALIITIAVNYLSNNGMINGETMGSVSAEYRNLFTPAGYAFSIWGLIYLLLIGFVVFQGKNIFREKANAVAVSATKEIGWWFILSCLANCLWIFAWLNHFILLSVLIMVFLLFTLLKIVINTRMEMENGPLKKFAFVWWPFCIYTGWISVALIANVAAYLTKIGWDGFGISEVTWTIIMIGIAGGINVFMTWHRNMREFALVGVWALVAIAVGNQQEIPAIFQTALAMAAIVFLSLSWHGFKNRKSRPW